MRANQNERNRIAGGALCIYIRLAVRWMTLQIRFVLYVPLLDPDNLLKSRFVMKEVVQLSAIGARVAIKEASSGELKRSKVPIASNIQTGEVIDVRV